MAYFNTDHSESLKNLSVCKRARHACGDQRTAHGVRLSFHYDLLSQGSPRLGS